MILEVILKAGKNSLILIDELDLLLHDIALKNLISVIYDRAIEKNLQIIFTTHRESVINLSGKVNIRHVLNLAERTFCFENTKPDAINRLTGVRVTSIEVYVEDDVAEAIIKKLCASLKATKHTRVIKYGAAVNAFTILGGTLLRGDNLRNSTFILDGDVIKTSVEKIRAINKVLTGDDLTATRLREEALEKIIQFRLPEGNNPEKYLHTMLIQSDETEHDDESLEIISIARSIHFREDSHDYLGQIILELGLNRSIGLTRIIDIAAKHPQWMDFTADVVNWLRPVVIALNEQE